MPSFDLLAPLGSGLRHRWGARAGLDQPPLPRGTWHWQVLFWVLCRGLCELFLPAHPCTATVPRYSHTPRAEGRHRGAQGSGGSHCLCCCCSLSPLVPGFGQTGELAMVRRCPAQQLPEQAGEGAAHPNAGHRERGMEQVCVCVTPLWHCRGHGGAGTHLWDQRGCPGAWSG